LARLTSGSINTGFSLNKVTKKENPKYSKEELDYINNHPDEYVDFEVPYNFSLDYILNYSKLGGDPSQLRQSASINGELRLTPQWKIAFTSFYDITEHQFTSLGLNFYRDLHCWEMRMNWIPFGYQESWNFQINVKASILQDLKLLKKKSFYD
jgi:lipopolysaccharide assembly outer membrane protein LptD (OstA)